MEGITPKSLNNVANGLEKRFENVRTPIKSLPAMEGITPKSLHNFANG